MNHFISLPRSAGQLRMRYFLEAGVNVQVRYPWNTIEPAHDCFDLNQVRSDASLAERYGRRIIAMIETKSFEPKEGEPKFNPMPEYMSADEAVENIRGGYTAALWDGRVMERYLQALHEVDSEMMKFESYEGLAVQETALGIDVDKLTELGYTVQRYRSQILRLFGRSEVFDGNLYWYFNYMAGEGNKTALAELVAVAARHGVYVGGPDILPGDPAIEQHVYPLIRSGPNAGRYFNSAQFDSYRHKKEDGTYWSPEEILQYARESLRAQIVFWNDKFWPGAAGEYTVDDALHVITARPVF